MSINNVESKLVTDVTFKKGPKGSMIMSIDLDKNGMKMLKALFKTSSFTYKELEYQAKGLEFLKKPYTLTDLAMAVLLYRGIERGITEYESSASKRKPVKRRATIKKKDNRNGD